MQRLIFAKIEAWLVLLFMGFAFALGSFWLYAVIEWKAFPYTIAREVYLVIKGDPHDQRPVIGRLVATFSYDPAEFVAVEDTELMPERERQPVSATQDAAGILPDLSGTRFFSDAESPRHFLVFGSFPFVAEQGHWGTILVDTKGRVHRGWMFRPERYDYRGAHLGLAITEDGLMATNMGGVLMAYDWCGEKRWESEWDPGDDGFRHHDAVDGYNWHHDITYHDGHFYTFRGANIMKVDAASGEIADTISAADMIRWGWKDDLHLFDARRQRFFQRDRFSMQTLVEDFHFDPFHLNKVDVLSEEAAASYEQFEAGDMLLSMRELNLVVAIRPKEEQVVWWRYGLTAAQHDASFVEGGVEVFDNNFSSVPPQPRILRLDLETQEAEVVFDLSKWSMQMRYGGNFLRDGESLMTIDDFNGRALVGKTDGSLDFVLESGWQSEDGAIIPLQLRNILEIDAETLEAFEAACNP